MMIATRGFLGSIADIARRGFNQVVVLLGISVCRTVEISANDRAMSIGAEDRTVEICK